MFPFQTTTHSHDTTVPPRFRNAASALASHRWDLNDIPADRDAFGPHERVALAIGEQDPEEEREGP
jgi:hypothetical protein